MAKLRGDTVVLQREEYRRLLARADAAHGAQSVTPRGVTPSAAPSLDRIALAASSRWKGGASHV